MTAPKHPRLLRALWTLLAVALAVPVFGLCAPFTLLALHALPSLGVGGVVYVAAGGLAGLVAGVVGARATLGDAALPTRGYGIFVAALALALVAAAVAARRFDAFAHV